MSGEAGGAAGRSGGTRTVLTNGWRSGHRRCGHARYWGWGLGTPAADPHQHTKRGKVPHGCVEFPFLEGL